MQEDSVHESVRPVKRDWRWWANWYRTSTYQFMCGFGIAAFAATTFCEQRPGWIPSPWHQVILGAYFASLVWYFWMLFPWQPQPDLPKSELRDGTGIFLFSALLGAALLKGQWNETSAVVCIGPCAAVFLWSVGRLQKTKPYFATVFWTVSGVAALALPWPNPQRFLAALVVGGFATALQGAFTFLGFRLELRKKPAEAAEHPAAELRA